MIGLVYDAGALIAADRDGLEFRKLHHRSVYSGNPRLVPAGALGQAWRDGARQARLCTVLRACELVPLDAAAARGAGALCGRAGTGDVIDASVVLLAAQRRAAIVTGDRGDIEKLLDALDPRLRRPAVIDI